MHFDAAFIPLSGRIVRVRIVGGSTWTFTLNVLAIAAHSTSDVKKAPARAVLVCAQ